jgi:small conductance mechanosensitive channel
MPQPVTDLSTHSWEATLQLSERFINWFATSGVRIVFIVFLAWAATAITRRVTRRIHDTFAANDGSAERMKRADTIAGVIRTIAGVVILLGSFMMILREIGLDIAPFVATAGIGGLALGFGAQSLVKDVITGFFVLIEDQVRVGDIVQIGDKIGSVEGISLRTIRLRDESGTVHNIPNSSVTIVSNMTRDFSRYVVQIPITANADPRQVFGVLHEIGEEMEKEPALSRDILEPLEILGLESPTKEPVVKARIKTRPRRQWAIGRELNLRIKKRFAETGIDLR